MDSSPITNGGGAHGIETNPQSTPPSETEGNGSPTAENVNDLEGDYAGYELPASVDEFGRRLAEVLNKEPLPVPVAAMQTIQESGASNPNDDPLNCSREEGDEGDEGGEGDDKLAKLNADLEKQNTLLNKQLDEADAKIVELKADHANKLKEISKKLFSALGIHITADQSDPDSEESDSEESQPSLGVGDLVKVKDTLGLEDRTGNHLQCGKELYVERVTPKKGLVNVSLEKRGDPLLIRAKDPSLFELVEQAVAQTPTHWLDLNQPFPMASDFLDPDCTFTDKSLREVPVQSEDGEVTWNGIKYRDREDFENLILKTWRKVFKGNSAMESSSYKTNRLKAETQWAFDECVKIKNKDVIDFETTEPKFRMDRHGNVVAFGGNGSITKFDVDHIFPWSRGGLTVRENLEALHSRVNSVVKNDKFLQELSKEELETGLREEQIRCLFKYIKKEKAFEGKQMVTREMKAKATWGNRKAQKYRDKAISWLTSTPGEGEELSAYLHKLQETISKIGRNEDGSYSGEKIFNFLEDWFEKGGAEKASQYDIPPPSVYVHPGRRERWERIWCDLASKW
ncbi:hypothetical protein TrST_g7451 [Triparma strigata]|uniref:HNH nuclease domain-containing protein n=1 Tax=Triparma strigata TaxID=1606541 RepID=A0A9W7BRT7_9STRA|nr:hypothetical protein TrST_g7451 [Triparma strigata]